MRSLFVCCMFWIAALSLAGCQSVPVTPKPVAAPEIRNAELAVGDNPDSASAASVKAPRPVPLDYENNVYFDLGKTAIDDRGMETLKVHAERLKSNAKLVVTLIGHTDNLGSREYNQAICEERLDSVENQLRSLGVGKRQIRRVGLGNEKTGVGQCRELDCQQAMHRVEMYYAPVAKPRHGKRKAGKS